jgi:hypothetical protein
MVSIQTERDEAAARQPPPQIEIKECLSSVLGDLQTLSFNLPTKFT